MKQVSFLSLNVCIYSHQVMYFRTIEFAKLIFSNVNIQELIGCHVCFISPLPLKTFCWMLHQEEMAAGYRIQ